MAYYLEADLKDKRLDFTVDTTFQRRLTPDKFYTKNELPLLVVNTTFFSFASNQNLNLVIKEGRLVSYNVHSVMGKGKDTLTWRHTLGSAIGISKRREADVAWLYTDSALKYPYVRQAPLRAVHDSVNTFTKPKAEQAIAQSFDNYIRARISFPAWKMRTAVGGGPVLLQDGKIRITNNEELKFAGKAIEDKHPRTAMGYTTDKKLIILVIEGRNAGIAEGATLEQTARLFVELGCVEALNLDGGGSSCMLVNGKETIRVSDKEGQRPVPAVFLIKKK
ncbi:MAG: phosphodiester glycosidase family protein [Chitinophagales bacterium]|nr:phosphodiester glycosidase family protein [Chitinophagales bacterium]